MSLSIPASSWGPLAHPDELDWNQLLAAGLGLMAAPSLAGDECVLCFQRTGGALWTTRCGAMRELTAS